MSLSDTSRLMKANTARDLGSRVAFNYEDLQQRCETYLAQVKEQAQQILLQATAEAEQAKRQAEATGRSAGFQAGQTLAEKESEKRVKAAAEQLAGEQLRTIVPALQTVLQQFEQLAQQTRRQAEQAVIQLSVAIAEKLLRQALPILPTVTPALIQEALQLASGSASVQLVLHPDDVTALEQGAAAESWKQIRGNHEINLIGDPQVARGGCLLYTPQGVIDGRWETQLQRIAIELLGEEPEAV